MRRICSRFVLGLVGFAGMAIAAAQAPTLQYVEPVALSVASDSTGFEAYGRRFSLSITDNGRVLQKISAER